MNYKNKGRNIVDVKEVQKRLGLRLRELRLAKNLRQEDLEKWNFSYRYYGMIERGLINPSLDTLFKLSTIFDVSLHELFRFLEIEGVTTDEREAVAIIISKILKENKKAKIKKLKIFLEEILTP
jgi:transcriptional regulator with XRE-family HTH domain